MRTFSLTKIATLDALDPLAPNVRATGTVPGVHPDEPDEWVMVGIDSDAPSAWVRGTRVVKAWNEPGDTHDLGACATVRGSVVGEEYGMAAELELGELVYCVEWDDAPGRPVFCRAKKLARSN